METSTTIACNIATMCYKFMAQYGSQWSLPVTSMGTRSGLCYLKITLFIPEQTLRWAKYEPASSTHHTGKHTGPEGLTIHKLAPVQLQELFLNQFS